MNKVFIVLLILICNYFVSGQQLMEDLEYNGNLSILLLQSLKLRNADIDLIFSEISSYWKFDSLGCLNFRKYMCHFLKRVISENPDHLTYDKILKCLGNPNELTLSFNEDGMLVLSMRYYCMSSCQYNSRDMVLLLYFVDGKLSMVVVNQLD